MKLAIATIANLGLVFGSELKRGDVVVNTGYLSHPGSHADCGYVGITKEACEKDGLCAYGVGLADEPLCYYKFSVPGVSSTDTRKTCEDKGGVWDEKAAKRVRFQFVPTFMNNYACYYPNTARLPGLNGRESNVNGHPGTRSYE